MFNIYYYFCVDYRTAYRQRLSAAHECRLKSALTGFVGIDTKHAIATPFYKYDCRYTYIYICIIQSCIHVNICLIRSNLSETLRTHSKADQQR